ncbi:MAG: hypothetical protein II890_06125, partial [Spirochaetia bacterium]|nr:hypothetical protein [Spirochaetia bacterium]
TAIFTSDLIITLCMYFVQQKLKQNEHFCCAARCRPQAYKLLTGAAGSIAGQGVILSVFFDC